MEKKISQSKEWSLVIEENNEGEELITKIKKGLEIITSNYFMILHDKDIIEESGERKRPHIHITLTTRTRTTRGGLLKDLQTLIGIEKIRISADITRNKQASIRYLLHLDQETKTQYDKEEVITNRQDLLHNAIALIQEIEELTAEKLIKILEDNGHNKKKTLLQIGLNQYARYCQIINMLCIENDIDTSFNKLKDQQAINKFDYTRDTQRLKKELETQSRIIEARLKENTAKHIHEEAIRIIRKKTSIK